MIARFVHPLHKRIPLTKLLFLSTHCSAHLLNYLLLAHLLNYLLHLLILLLLDAVSFIGVLLLLLQASLFFCAADAGTIKHAASRQALLIL
jgi:hypothetical protein